jgi:hypothetical protein
VSDLLHVSATIYLLQIFSRVKEKLRSGEMAVSGEHWPIFVYQGNNYDPDDPWHGLLRSSILVSVSSDDCFGIL